MFVVPKGYEYYIDSLNYYHFQAIIPLAYYNYRVEVVYPVRDIVVEEVPKPKITISDIIDWLPSLRDYIDDENHTLHNIAKMLIEIGRNTIEYSLCGSDLQFKRVVSLYVGHYLEFHFAELKDENYKMSLQPIDNTKETEDKKVEISYDSFMGEYKNTMYGRHFWTLYGQHAKFLVGYRPI